jgi:hypothetical protein
MTSDKMLDIIESRSTYPHPGDGTWMRVDLEEQ